MASLDLKGTVHSFIDEKIESPDQLLGKGALIPFNNTNSGSRKLMFSVHVEQTLPLFKPEVPMVQTGYENQYGKYSSSFIQTNIDQEIVAKIDKFNKHKNYHYFLFTIGEDTVVRVIERVTYKHVSEAYGYLYDNNILDSYNTGEIIKGNTVIHKSNSFDENNNRMDGLNLLTAYMASDYSMEDGIIISESAAKKLSSPLLKKVEIIINDNDIPLNLYGKDDQYKSFPDIGEYCENGVLCALRRENKESALFTQSYNRLKSLIISDEKFTVIGKVIDIDVRANNPEKLLESQYYSQINEYYQDNLRFCREVVETLDRYKNLKWDHEVQVLYSRCTSVLAGMQYISERVFSNVILEITILEENTVHQGDKLSNRYGCKGVISKIYPDDIMPRTSTGDSIEVLLNMNTVTNREDPGQLFELSLNYISSKIIQIIQYNILDVSQAIDLYLTYLKMISEKLYTYAKDVLDSVTYDEDLLEFLYSLVYDDGIYLSIDPMAESMDIDKLLKIYEEFSWIKPEKIYTPILDSNNNIRFVPSRRPVIAAKQYFYRLKQYAKEKFSVTSLSSTNIRNENSRNKANKVYKALYAKTPIRLGDMEIGDFIHAGVETIVEVLLIYSSSPDARRLTRDLMVGDPFNIDIKLDDFSKNRSAEILNAYLKTIGLRLIFRKEPKKKIIPMIIDPMVFEHVKPMIFDFIEPMEFDGMNPNEKKDIHIAPMEFIVRE